MFIRKLLDLIFTKRELSWLDDLMPEWKKKKLEDAEQEVHHIYMKHTSLVLANYHHCNNPFLFYFRRSTVLSQRKVLFRCHLKVTISKPF